MKDHGFQIEFMMHAGIHHRDMCKAIQVEDGNSCSALATRCGITPAAFTKYNLDKSLCSSLRAG